MRYLVGLIGVLLMLVGGFGAFDGFMTGRTVETVHQQISERIKFYGSAGLFVSGLIALAITGVESAVDSVYQKLISQDKKETKKTETEKTEVDEESVS